AGELLGLDPHALVPDGADMVAERLWGHRVDLGSLMGEVGPAEHRVHIDGSPYSDLAVQLFPVDVPGEESGVGLVIRDVTAELELARAKDELVAIVSHELRTPLAVVVGFAELLTHHVEGRNLQYAE